MIIDCHGHFTTAPAPLAVWRQSQIDALVGTVPMPGRGPEISDDELCAAIEANQLRLMDERGTDMTIFSPRASFMAHHIGGFAESSAWSRICNDVCARVRDLYPDRFAFAAMLPQSPRAAPDTVLPELRRCVEELGAVGINLNPDPSGGAWSSPPLTDRSWYPLYEAMVDYDVPAMVHVSTATNPALHTTGAHYLGADTTVFMQLISGDLFRDFPTLRLIIPHGGGAVPYHWGRFRGLAMAMGKPPLTEHVLGNVFFDTCVYHQAGIDLLLQVVPVDNVLFASEMIGAVRDIDPLTGRHFDDTLPLVRATGIDAQALDAVTSGNAKRVYPRLP